MESTSHDYLGRHGGIGLSQVNLDITLCFLSFMPAQAPKSKYGQQGHVLSKAMLMATDGLSANVYTENTNKCADTNTNKCVEKRLKVRKLLL